jgi:hypothetical protein
MMMFALFRLFAGIKRLTGLGMEDILHAQAAKPVPAAARK